MNEKLTFADVIDLLAKKAKISKKDAESFLRELFAIIYDNILENEIVKVKDFGSFKPTLISSRESVDVNTGLKIQIPAHYRLTFTPDKTLKDLVNKPFASFESILLDDTADVTPSFATETVASSTDEEEEDIPVITLTADEPKLPEPESAEPETNNKPQDKSPVRQTETGYTQTVSPIISPNYNYSYVSQDKDGERKTTISVPITEIISASQPQITSSAIEKEIVVENSPTEEIQHSINRNSSD
ncbi:MAG: HU family DNA-binding protein, partial [Dysgonomonas sp.]